MSGNTNTSATGGYLLQTDTLPLNDNDLDDVLQQLVVGVTALDGELVRPRWQRPGSDPNTPPTQPSPSTNWCSIGVVHQDPHDYPYDYHVGTGDGYSVQVSWETLSVIASFMGPNCRGYASTMRAGLYVGQNRESLIPTGIKLREVGDVVLVPDLVNMQWISRCDVPIIFDREIRRIYQIQNLKSAQGGISTDSVSPLATDKILVTNPMPA